MILLLVTMKISVMAMAYSMIVSSISSQIINSYPNWKLLGYSYLEQLRDILPSILLAIAMGGCVSLVSFLPLGTLAILLLQILLGGAIYLAGSALFKLESFEYLLQTIHGFRRNAS